MTTEPARPVVLLAEPLSPSTVEALGADVEIHRCDGTTGPRSWPRSPRPTRS